MVDLQNQWASTRVLPPVTPLLTAAEVKKVLRLSANNSVHDDVLTDLIDAATEQVTHETELVGTQATYGYYRDTWSRLMRLPYRPVSQVLTINYYDSDGNMQSLDSAEYTVSLPRREVYFPASFAPPQLDDRRDAIEVLYLAGYADAASVPKNYRQLVLMAIGNHFRDPYQESNGGQETYDRMVASLRRGSYP